MSEVATHRTSRQEHPADWRTLPSGLRAWFVTPSASAAAVLAIEALQHWKQSPPGTQLPDLDLRPAGLALTFPGAPGDGELALAERISRAAADRGFAPDPAVLQEFDWVIRSGHPKELLPFWRAATGRAPANHDPRPDDPVVLRDADRRQPSFTLVEGPIGPLRDRVHVDLAHPSLAERGPTLDALGSAAGGPYGLRRADADGNEIDLIGGDPLQRAEDWSTVFGAQVCYPTTDPDVAVDLVVRAATLADEHRAPALVDLRAAGSDGWRVFVDSGKDRWEEPGFTDFAADVQAHARDVGLTPDATRPWFVQVCIDGVDLAALRSFWSAALGYEFDPREQVTDLNDPRWLTHPILFQSMEADDTARREQPGRIHVRVAVPADRVEERRQEALAAGGRPDADGESVLDPEGNRLTFVAAS